MLADGVVEQGGDLGFVANVHWMEMGFAALVADCGGGFFTAVLLDVGEDYGGAFGGGLAGASEAEALGGAGYEDYFILEAGGPGGKESTEDRLPVKAKPKIGNPKEFRTKAAEANRETGKKVDEQ